MALIFPNLRIESGSDGLYHVNTAEIDVIEGFPSKNGYYIPDPRYAIPCGRETGRSTQSALYLYRSDEPYVGVVVPWEEIVGSHWHVDAHCSPRSREFGVVVDSVASLPQER